MLQAGDYVRFQERRYVVVSVHDERAILRPADDGQIREYVLIEIDVPVKLVEPIVS